MSKRVVHGILLIFLLTGLLAVTPPTPTRAATASAVDESMLNADGTLNMSKLPAGSIDPSGWDVNLDPTRGPVFSPIASEGNWSDLGTTSPINDGVNTILVDGTDVYLGGTFSNAGGVDEADSIARWDGTTWHSLSNNGSGGGVISGNAVNKIIKVGSVFYVAGNFSGVNNTSNTIIPGSAYLAKWDGTAWSSADGDTTSAISGHVSSLAYLAGSPGYLYVAGEFTNADGIAAADRIARLNLTTNTWEALGADSGGDGAIDNWALSVAVDSAGTVYVGGFFTNADDIAEADYIAKWDSINEWQALGSTPLSSIVGDIVIDASNNVYAGGNFINAGGIAEADYIAKWNGSAWSALSNNGSGNGAVIKVNGGGGGTTVQDMQIVGNELYVVGLLGLANDATADYVIKYDLNTAAWSGFGNNGSGNGSISNAGYPYAIAFTGSILYVGGAFPDVNNSGTSINNSSNFAAYTSTNSWQSVGGENAFLTDNYINVIVSAGSNVYIGGSFANLNGDPSIDYIARWDGTTWHSLGNTGFYAGPLSLGNVQDIEVDGNNIYVVGAFTSANNNGNPIAGAVRIAKWDGTSWSAIGGGINNGTIYEVEVDANDNVYIGGSFTNAGGNTAADRIAMWNGASWNSLSSNGASEGAIASGNIYALEMQGNNLYAGGDFLNVVNSNNATIANTARLALWNGSAWSAVPNLTSPLNGPVYTMTISNSDLYIGGVFSDVNSMPAADYIARWNGTVWSALGSGSAGNGSLSHRVNTIVVRGSSVYVGGDFINVYNNDIEVTNAEYIARFDGTSWSGLGSNGASGSSINSYVTSVAIHENDLWASGGFQNVNNNGNTLKNADYLATFGLPAPTALPAGWVGSVSVTSDKNVVAVGRPHIDSEVASYDGFSAGSPTAFVPMLFKDAFGGSYDAALYVQNVSGSSAPITLQYFDSAGTLNCTKTDTISPLASKGYWLPSVTCDSGSLPTGWVGGVKIESEGQPIVAVGRPHIGSEVMTYNGFSSGSTSAFIPMLFKGAFGGSYNAAFYIQNVDTSNLATVTIEYFDSAGTLNCTKEDTIAPLASKGYWVPVATCDAGSLPAGWVGGVKITSDQPIVTVGRPHIGSQITTYSGFSAGSSSAFVPMLFKDAFGGSYDAAFYLQNVGASSASVTIKYYDNAGTLNCTKSDTLAPQASKGYWVPTATCDSGSLPTGWVGGVEVTSDQPIVAVGRPHIGAQVTTYNGFSAGNTSAFLPMLFKDAFGGSYDAAFYIQNTEATAASVTIQFYDSTGSLTCSRVDIIQPRATLGFWMPSTTCIP